MTNYAELIQPEYLREYGVLAVAFLGACIALGQWSTSRSKLILDLYDKRRAVYSQFHGPIGKAIRDGASNSENLEEFKRIIDQAKFLFGRDVLYYFDDMQKELALLMEASDCLREGGLTAEARGRYSKQRHDSGRALLEFWNRLDRLMVPYMLMEQRRPWSFSRVRGYVAHLRRRLLTKT